MPPPGTGEMLWAVGDYDLAPSEWLDLTRRAHAVTGWTAVLRESYWQRGLVLAEKPTVSFTPPEQLGEIYQAQGMGKLHLRARAWRRLDHERQHRE